MGTVSCECDIAAAVGSLLATLTCKDIKVKVIWAVEVILNDSLANQWCGFVEHLTVVKLGAVNGVTVEAFLLVLAREGHELVLNVGLLRADNLLFGLGGWLVASVVDKRGHALGRLGWPAARTVLHAEAGATGTGELVDLFVGAYVVRVAIVFISVHT